MLLKRIYINLDLWNHTGGYTLFGGRGIQVYSFLWIHFTQNVHFIRLLPQFILEPELCLFFSGKDTELLLKSQICSSCVYFVQPQLKL